MVVASSHAHTCTRMKNGRGINIVVLDDAKAFVIMEKDGE